MSMLSPLGCQMKYIDELCSRLRYDNGILIWVNAGRRSDRNGMQAGSVSKTDGYVYIKYKQKRIGAHRIIYYIHNGFIPSEIDHINRVRSDNRIENLRDAITHTNNLGNQSVQKRHKTSIYKGVCWDSNREKWMASIKISRKFKYLGRFSSEDEAAKAYNRAAIEIFGEFANINKIQK